MFGWAIPFRMEPESNGTFYGTDHPLCPLAMALIADEEEGTPSQSLSLFYPTTEVLNVELYEMSVVDGTGRELTREWLSIGRRASGGIVALDGQWVWQGTWDHPQEWAGLLDSLQLAALRIAQRRVYELCADREELLNKKAQFLQRAFDAQYDQAAKRLEEYHRTNVDNRNSALINQVNAAVGDRREASVTTGRGGTGAQRATAYIEDPRAGPLTAGWIRGDEGASGGLRARMRAPRVGAGSAVRPCNGCVWSNGLVQ